MVYVYVGCPAGFHRLRHLSVSSTLLQNTARFWNMTNMTAYAHSLGLTAGE